jgi:polysaccharide biosynthesis transport protein
MMRHDDIEYEENDGNAVMIDRAISAVHRHLKLIAAFVVVATALAVVYALQLQNYYESYAIVQVDPRKKSITQVEGVIANMRGDAATIESEVDLLRSRTLLLQVIDRLKLRQDPEFNLSLPAGSKAYRPVEGAVEEATQLTNQPATIEELLNGKTDQSAKLERDWVAANLARHLSVRRVRNTLLIEIRVFSRDPVKAAQIANTFAEVYLRSQISAKEKAATLATDLLKKKIAKLRTEVTASERDVEAFKTKHQIFGEGSQTLGASQLARLMEQTVLARNTTATAKAKYEQARDLLNNGHGSGNLAEVLQSDTIRNLKNQLAQARRTQAELATKYGPRHPDMVKVQADAREAQRQLNSEISRLVSNIKNEYSVAQMREQQLLANLQQLKSKESQTNEVSVQLSELKRTADNDRQLYEALLTRYKSTAETLGMQLPDVRVAERADVPLHPSGPRRKRIVFLTFLASLGLGLLLALAREFLTFGMTRPEEAERTLELAHLSSVPALGDREGDGFNPLHGLRMIVAEPRSNYAEAIRGLRRELDVRLANRPTRIIAVTSSLPQEGTETIASNLAHHYALTQNRVLLIDCDLRRAALTRRLAPQRSNGLLEVLWHGLAPEKAILFDQSTGLHFMPAMGPSPLEPASPELLASRGMADMLGQLRQRFDTIIFDTPPLLPVIDGRIVADYADQIVFAVTWRKTPKQLAKRAIRLLGANADKLAGVVVNQVDPAALEEAQGFSIEPRQVVNDRQKYAA